MTLASKKRKIKEMERKLVTEGILRQTKYNRMTDILKSGHCSSQFSMFDSIKQEKVYNTKLNKGKKNDIKIIYGDTYESI